MERLEAKKINGRTYYYYSKWGWVDGRCRRLWQKYLGKLEDMARAVEGGGPQPLYADIFQWGLPSVLWMECCDSKVIEETDRLCPKREQGLSVGQYLAIAAVNRAISPRSKRCMWEWLSQTVLLRHIPQASKAVLSSQRFWDHMDKIDAGAALSIWKGILKGVVRSRDIDLSRVSYDGTNFYTFIATFNVRSSLAKRGKNKQGRSDLRQVSYALFCSADGHMPLYYDVYEGSRNDAKEFPLILKRFHGFLKELTEGADQSPATTLIFDKGNNSEENFRLIDSLNLSYVGSVKLDQHKDLAQISNKDTRFMPCLTTPIDGTKAFRVKKKVYGRERILVVTFNQNLFDTQWLTIHNDISKALEKLSTLRQRLEDRANGIIKGGKPPTKQSVENQCKDTLSRQYMKLLIKTTITQGSDGIPQLCYELDSDSLGELADTCLGKNIIITDREDWDDEVDHISVSQSVHNRGSLQGDERSTDGKLVAPPPLDGFKDHRSWSVLLCCVVAEGPGIPARKTGRHPTVHAQAAFRTRRYPRGSQHLPQEARTDKEPYANRIDTHFGSPESYHRDPGTEKRRKRRFRVRNFSA